MAGERKITKADLTVPDIAGRDISPRPERVEQTGLEVGAKATAYTMLGVESTMESTRQDRQKLSEEGISSHPIAFGVAYYRREHRVDI